MIVKDQKTLNEKCKALESEPFITIDTEFLRERTYFSKLCLIQVSGPDKAAFAIDVIEAPELDLGPLLSLFRNEAIIKVLHAGRQDMEIFWQSYQTLPIPLFDTQIAAMVLGHGEQIGFHNLAKDVTNTDIDKSQQFTDWSRRPLSDKQLQYALDDVIYLVDIYKVLQDKLEERGRAEWVLEETEALLDTSLYEFPPEEAYKRIKVKTQRAKQMAVLRELAAWREQKAQEQNIPRTHILRDETLVDISFHPPEKPSDLTRIRGFPKNCEDKPLGQAILKASKKGVQTPKETWPKIEKKRPLGKQYRGALEMLKMLAKIKANEHDVTPRLIASNDDLELLAQSGAEAKIPALKGWRKRVFGEDALILLKGEKGLYLDNNEIKLAKI